MKLTLANIWGCFKYPEIAHLMLWDMICSNSVLRVLIYYPVRWFQGARRMKEARGPSGTSGSYSNAVCDIHFGGACPVQSDFESQILGLDCYYRARHESWSLTVYSKKSAREIWYYGERCYYGHAGGWLPAEESVRNLEKAVTLFIEDVRRDPSILGDGPS
jgi:hypothetical protein